MTTSWSVVSLHLSEFTGMDENGLSCFGVKVGTGLSGSADAVLCRKVRLVTPEFSDSSPSALRAARMMVHAGECLPSQKSGFFSGLG